MATVLVVDDYAPNHRLTSFILQQSGHAVIAVLNGQQALERLCRLSIDVVLTDLTMPLMDGVSLVEHLRADVRFSALPIIMLTASGREQDHTRARAAGVTTFLTKPIESDALVSAVNTVAKGC